MDKNKNRTDLLAAGRKKLQQYRQKKDGKGSKSLGKANKPDRDVITDESSSVAKPSKGKKQLSEVEEHVEGPVTELVVDSSSQESTDNLVATKADVMTPDLSSTPNLPIEVSEADESIDASVPDKDQQSSNLDDALPTISSPRRASIEGKHESGFVPVTPVGLKAVLDDGFARKAGELNAARGEDQEHDRSCSEPDNRTSLIDLDGDMKPASSTIDENAQVNTGNFEEDTSEEHDGFSAFASSGDRSGATISEDVHSVSVLQSSDPEPTAKRKEVAADVHGDESIKLPPGVISGQEDAAVSLSQLAQVFRSLGDDEYRFLVAARDSVISGDLKSDVLMNYVSAEFRERLEEQLYISNLEKDLIYLQLCQELDARKEFEQQRLHWVNEKSTFSAFLGNVEGKNKILSEELALCRSELDRVTSEMEKLQMSFSFSNTELERSSARIDELQMELNRSAHQLSHASSELVDSRSLLSDLQVTNENLNLNIASLTEEKFKFEKEKGDIILENEKLMKELMECKSFLELSQVENVNVKRSVEALHMEIARLNEVLTSERDARGKLEEANHRSVQESKKFSLELLESQHLVESLRLEISNLSESLDLVTKERTKVIEEMNQLSNEKEAALKEVTNSKALMKDLQVEYEKSMNDRDLQLEKLTAEIVCLTSTLDMYKAKVTEFNDWKIKPEQRVFEHSLGFVALKRRLSEVEKVMLELDKAIAGISDSKAVSPGVSKLVRNFESKGHFDESEESPLGEDSELHLTAKRKIVKLKDLFMDLVLDAENASELFKVERNDNDKLEEVTAHQAMKEQSNSLEEMFFKHVILDEIMKQYVCTVETKKDELVALCEDLRQEGIIEKTKNSELTGKLCNSESTIRELQVQVDELRQQTDHMNSLSNQLESLQRKLDASIGTISVTHSGEADAVQNLIARVSTYVDAAIAMIQDLQGNNNSLSDSYKEMAEKTKDLEGRNELAAYVIHKVFDNLQKLVNDSGSTTEESEDDTRSEQLDHLEISNYDVFIERLIMMLRERAHLESMNREYNLELLQRIKDIEELNRKCIHPDVIVKLLEDLQTVVTSDVEIKPHEPVSSLESMIYFFVMRNKSAEEQVDLLGQSLKSKETKMIELQNQRDHLSVSIIPYEIESCVYKESLRSAMEQLVKIQSETHLKENELHQSEQRVSALREKLHIAVTKGKGLIQQRDSLKQNLTATSSELEKCLHELQVKETALQETETKLKTYSEAGERMEALESELSYIRNSATALRESFLLKDSVLQRIEEILEDLELPEHFHVRDIIDKIDWLAKSVSHDSFPVSSSNQMGSIERSRSYPESRSGALDGWKEVLEPASGPDDDELRRNYEELQNKFYGLAEQNEMLEQSLMERNDLVQRWEEVLDKISIPPQLRSLEPEDRIEWLSTSLSEANDRCDSLQRDNYDLEKVRDSLAADLEESQRRLIDLEAALHSITDEREQLSSSLEVQRRDYSELSKKASSYEINNDKLQNEVGALQLKLDEEHIVHGEIRRLQEFVKNMLQVPETEDLDSSTSDIQHLEELLRKLADKYTAQTESSGWLAHKEISVEQSPHRELDLVVLEKKLEEVEVDLLQVKDERDRQVETNQSLVHQVESLEVRNEELQKLLVQEEQKSAAVREKLNVAVRKGKSLVQQRDGMKQTINELTSQVVRLNAEIKVRETTVMEYQQKMKDLIISQEVMEDKISEIPFLKSRLLEVDSELHDKRNMWSTILGALAEVDIGVEFRTNDPVEKLQQIAKVFGDLQVAMSSAEQDSRKSKRAAELLLAELNEVQERNEDLLEELSKATMQIAELSKERDSAEAAKHEFLSRLEHLSALHLEERSSQLSELLTLKSCLDKLRPGFSKINNLLNDVLPKDLHHLYNLEASVKSLLESSDTSNVGAQTLNSSRGGISSMPESKVNFHSELFLDSKTEEQHYDQKIIDIWRFVGSHMQDLMTNVNNLEENLLRHAKCLHEEVIQLSETLTTLRTEMNSDLESAKEEIAWLESTGKQKETENVMLRKYLSMLYEACKSSVLEIEKSKGVFVANDSFGGEDILSGETLSVFEAHITSMVNRLLSLAKDFHRIQVESLEVNLKEMKATISSLQKELTEKDVQKDRISVELVNQIKQAKAAAMSSLQELEPAKAEINDLKGELEAVSVQRNMLEQKVKELEGQESILVDLHKKVESLTNALTSKEQEAEALLQALDEEEAQMEELTNKVNELERVLQQKDLDLETAEAARGKALKKLSITVSKFDELHHLSETLVSEVDKLQSQLQERDSEISFLRDEITRCTSDSLLALETGKRELDQIQDILTWFNSMICGVETYDVHLDDNSNDQIHEYKEILKKQITSIISELKDLRQVAQSKDDLLNIERSKVEDLMHRQELLKKSLREKESRLSLHQDDDDSARVTSATSEIVEVEPVINKWSLQGTSIAPQVRSLRKVNNEQLAISIDDMDSDDRDKLEDEDDDKAHGFKSLTTSKLVPKFTRPVTNFIDGLWVSCDRALMRQPVLRLSLILYWALMHALLAVFVV